MAPLQPESGKSIDMDYPSFIGSGKVSGANTSITNIFTFTPTQDCIVNFFAELQSTSGTGQVYFSYHFTDMNGLTQFTNGGGVFSSPSTSQVNFFYAVKGGTPVRLETIASGTSMYYDLAYNYIGNYIWIKT